MREKILGLLAGKKIDTQPVFSGLIHVTLEGVDHEHLAYHEIHHDPLKMAKAAGSTYRLTGMPSAALPLDLCAPAEALGAELTFDEYREWQFPQVKRPIIEKASDIGNDFHNHTSRGRILLICEAIDILKKDLGTELVLAGTIPGPYTLLLYLCDPRNLFIEMKKEPEAVLEALVNLSSLLGEIGQRYINAGADFITVHEMGGSPGFIGPAKFEQFVLPALKSLNEQLSAPRVLSVCGNTNTSMHLLGQCGAQAVSVDQTNNLSESRNLLKDILLFGNLDPVQTLWKGEAAQVAESVSSARAAGVDAVWPGCDLVPQTPIRNIRTLAFQ